MSKKTICIFDKVWFEILEVIMAIIYFISIYYRATNFYFKMNGYVISLMVDIIVICFFVILMVKTINNYNKKRNCLFTYIYSFLLAIDMCINDSLVSILFVTILVFFGVYLQKTRNGYHLILDVLLSFMLGVEIVSVVTLVGVVKTDSIMLQSLQSIWIDICFVLTIVFEVLAETKYGKEEDGGKKHKTVGKFSSMLVSILAITIDVICVGVLIIGMYLRINDFCITSDNIEDGTSVYIVAAGVGNETITQVDNKLMIDNLTNADNQIFTFQEAEVDGYWHVVSNNENVVDVLYVLFEEDNEVIAWEENGVSGQHWTVEDVGNNGVMFCAYLNDFILSWDVEDKILDLTANKFDENGFFFLKNADIVNRPFVGWIVNSNKPIVIVSYLFMTCIIFVFTIIVVVKKSKRCMKENIEYF